MFRKAIYLLLVSALAVIGVVHAAERCTPEEAKALVGEAVSYLNEHGKDQALAEFNKPESMFVKDELYVFVLDTKGMMVAHPKNPTLIGENLLEEDSQDKVLQGSGWLNYVHQNPTTKTEETKTTYFQRVGDLIILCGAYQ